MTNYFGGATVCILLIFVDTLKFPAIDKLFGTDLPFAERIDVKI
jgi:hypothetical protein